MNSLTCPEDVDGVLRAFFQSEMPQPWPVLKVPAYSRPLVRPGRRRFGSRLALAASVAILMAGSLGLSGAFQGRDLANAPAPSGKGIDVGQLPAPLKHSAEIGQPLPGKQK